jgi:ssDNA-binding Zn-finger/Zn-ribbon topoisomerase 1
VGARAGDGPAPALFDGPGGEPTLDELVSGVWEGLAAREQVPCPVCGGQMVAGYGAHARPIEGRCTDCGTTLS